MSKKQFIEGELRGCKKNLCEDHCCDDDEIVEWVSEYFAYHERMKDHLAAKGIKIEFIEDRVKFKNCSDGKNCKFLKYSLNKDIDSRPIDCKIYPYMVDWETIDFNKRVVRLFYWDNDCPIVKNNSIPISFKKEVETIIKRDFSVLFYGCRFTIKFIDKVKS